MTRINTGMRTVTSLMGKRAALAGIFVFAVAAITLSFLNQSASAAYGDLSRTLPDDNYKLKLPNGNDANSDGLNCYPPDPTHGFCKAYYGEGGGSHQYITLSNGQINDSRRDADYYGADSTDFSVYSMNQNTRQLSLQMVERAITNLGCQGYTLEVTYSKPYGNSGKPVDIPINGCKGYSLPDIDGRYFYADNTEDNVTYAFHANVSIKIKGDGNRQASFHISTSGDAKMSYSNTWVNTYPTNAADGHKVEYSFRPDCDIQKGTAIEIGWDNLDYPSSFQPNEPGVRLYRHNTEGGNKQLVREYNAGPNTTQKRTFYMNDDMYNSNDRPYSFTLEFTGIRGGNGISFLTQYDSALAKIECPPKKAPSKVNANCNLINVRMPNDGKTHRYRIYINDGKSPGGPVDTNKDGDTYNDNVDYGDTAGSNELVTKDLVKDGKLVHGLMAYTVVVYNGSAVSTGIHTISSGNSNGACYTATCSINVVENVPNAPDGSNAVQAGKRFGVWVAVTNMGINDLPATAGNKSLSATLDTEGVWGPNPDNEIAGKAAPARLNQTIYPGATKLRYFELDAPNDQGNHGLSMYPEYWKDGPNLGGDGYKCYAKSTVGGYPGTEDPVGIPTFARYDFDATANSDLDTPESPTKVTFSSSIKRQPNRVDVNGTATRTFYKYNSTAPLTQLPYGPLSESATFGDRNYLNDEYAIPPNSFTLGDGYCVSISLDRGHGWKSSEIYFNENPAVASNCANPETVQNRPYVRTYGGDIAAGGGFSPNCGNSSSSGIHTYMFPRSRQENEQKSGSGSQLAAMALGPITGFMSATIRTSPPSIPNGLTFAHGTGAVTDDTDATLGGNMLGDGWCMPDFYGSTQFNDATNKTTITSGADINVNTLADQKQTVVNLGGSGSVRLTGGTVYNKHHTVYVDGNVFISNSIAYNTNYGAGVQSIPSFTLVVKGNIFISSDVSQLDGLYIAQPNGQANTGRIYTCSSGAAPLASGADIYNTCGANENGNRRQLTVNGAFMAERVILNRAGYTLRNSGYRETAANSKAAEIFKFSPEIYMSPPVFRSNGTSTSGDYDYLSILAPIL